jgi:hypothetical protein
MNHLSGCSSGKSCKNVNLGEWIHQLLYIIFNHTQRQLLSTIWAEAMTKSAQFKRQCNFSDSFCDAFYEMCYWCYNPSILLVANPDLTLLTWWPQLSLHFLDVQLCLRLLILVIITPKAYFTLAYSTTIVTTLQLNESSKHPEIAFACGAWLVLGGSVAYNINVSHGESGVGEFAILA